MRSYPSAHLRAGTRVHRPGRLRVVPRLLAATLAFGAQGIHLSILADQVQLWLGYGLFFVIIAVGHGLLGVSLLFDDPSRRTAWLGIVLSLGVALVWVSVNLAGVATSSVVLSQRFAGPGLAATVLEMILALLLYRLGTTRQRATPRPMP